jgi:hypothetical protein
MRWPRSETAVPALLLAGLALCVVPWLWRRPLDAPASFDETHAVVGRALAAIDEADMAFAHHDAERLRAAVTAEYFAALRASLRWLGVRIEGAATGLPAGSLGGELRLRPFRGGRRGGDRLVLGFDLGDAERDAGYPVARGLKLVVLQWNGDRLLLHAVQEEVLPTDRDPDAAFAVLAGSWLPASP